MNRNAVALMVVLSSLSLLIARESAAEIPQVELGGGYTYLDFSDGRNERALPLGWNASATMNVRERLGLVWEFNGYRSVDLPDLPYLSEDRRLSSQSLLFGPRFSLHRDSRVSAFVDVLGGVTSSSFRGVFDWYDADTRLAAQPGVGIQVALRRNIGLRVQGDVRMLFGEYPVPGFLQPRFSASMVIGLGKLPK